MSASQAELLRRRRALRGPHGQLVAPKAWEAWLEPFEEYLKSTPQGEGRILSDRTRAGYLRHLRAFALTADVGPWDVPEDQVESWLTQTDMPAETRDKARTALRRFYTWGLFQGLVERPPVALPRTQILTNGWDVAIEGFASHLANSGRATGTAECYVKHVGWLATSVKAGPWELDPRELGEWLDAQNWALYTRRKVLTSLRTFYAWAVNEGLAEWAPVAGLQSPVNAKRGPQRLEFTRAWREPGWAFLAWLASTKRTPETIDNRRLLLRQLSEVSADPWAVTTRQLQLWLSNPDWAPGTARVARSAVREFYRWAELDERIPVSPAARLEPIRVPRGLPRPIPDAPLRAALAAADDRTRLILMLGALGGLRRAETAALHTRHVSETEIFITGKGGHQRRVPMHPLLWEEISVELARRKDGRHGSGWTGQHVTSPGFLFPSDEHPGHASPAHVGRLARLVLPEPWGTHSLRHRFATMSYAEQRDLLAVQQLLGHAKPETTAVYAQVPDGALRTAVLGVTL